MREPARACGRVGASGFRLHPVIEDEFAILDAVGAVGGESDVAVLVNAVGADDALSVLGREDLLDHGGAIAALGAGALDRVEDQTDCLVAVDGVAVGVLVAVLGFVVSEELLAGGAGTPAARRRGS